MTIKWTNEQLTKLKSKNFNMKKFLKEYPKVEYQQAWFKNRSFKLAKAENNAIKQGKSKKYKEVPGKDWIQDTILQNCSGMNCDTLILLGPIQSSDRFLHLLKKHDITGRGKKITSYELKPEVCAEQITKYANKHKFMFMHRDNVANASAERFMDIDLMCKWHTAEKTIISLSNKQKIAYKNNPMRKVFNFSFSYMKEPCGLLTVLIENCLSKILNTTVNVLDTITINVSDTCKVQQYLVSKTSYIINVYYYSDSSPMVSISIQY